MKVLKSIRTHNGIRLLFAEKYKIDIHYRTRTDVTPRTIETAEAFGLGIDDERTFAICDNVEVDINQGDVIYITGDSGSGKSSILKELEKIFEKDCINIANVQVDRTKPLVDAVSKTTEEALELLSKVGLNDAFLFIRKFDELSDGQKYRFKLALLIESGKSVWICDEFCSTLDRDTAKIVAYNVQKLARQLGKSLFVATCNTDLEEDLNPSVRIHKRFGKEIEITYTENKPAPQCSLVKEMVVEKGTLADYKALAEFHYRESKVAYVRKVTRLMRGSELCGVLVYIYPPVMTFGRTKAMGRVVKVHELNKLFSTISRVVVHPKYRTIGLGVKLVRESLLLCPTPYAETIAVMAKYNPFFERAGMTKVEIKTPQKEVIRAVIDLERLGFDKTYLASMNYTRRKLEAMTPEQIEKVKLVFILNYHERYARNFTCSKYDNGGSKGHVKREEFARALKTEGTIDKLERLIKILALMAQTSVYLIYKKEGETQ